jgi:hypothetical protein
MVLLSKQKVNTKMRCVGPSGEKRDDGWVEGATI